MNPLLDPTYLLQHLALPLADPDGSDRDPGLGIESDCIGETAFARLLRLSGPEAAEEGPVVLAIAPFSGHFTILLRDLLLGLMPGRDVHVLEWKGARDIPERMGEFGLDDNIAAIMDAIGWIRRPVHLIGLCQSAVPALAATSLLCAGRIHPPRSLTLMGGNIDARVAPSRISRLAAFRPIPWLEHNVIRTVRSPHPGAGRRVYPASIQRAGLTAYLMRHLTAGGELLGKLLQDDGLDPIDYPFLRGFLSLMDLPARVFLDTVRQVFQEFALPRGRLAFRGIPVEPAAIEATGLLTIEGEKDDVSSPGQTLAAHELCRNLPPSRRRHFLQPGSGHFSLMHGEIWRRSVLSLLAGFIAEMD